MPLTPQTSSAAGQDAARDILSRLMASPSDVALLALTGSVHIDELPNDFIDTLKLGLSD